MKVFVSSSTRKTQHFAKQFAHDIAVPQEGSEGALVVGLQGPLGSGKTTFAQGFARGLGVIEKILSPTFVIIKRYKIPDSGSSFHILYHIDCYRIEDVRDILELGWEEIVSDPRNIVLIEWPERIQNILPKDILLLEFQAKGEYERAISLVH
ncbi:MAG: tRNA (adenosine(37)-N6)-threonylcarbamoyltransferase complex ATPase subunit type 1 TsaE [Candidatus Wildermuthbacteria bacterium]|nr:tRNA (adenosine(37)-N6)-threonylcarbamoyltransferase complex ATPase subunit type 1 TsaE [Candidatus Wildermuthbacteria bacterium]